jgi:hypothetical protein
MRQSKAYLGVLTALLALVGSGCGGKDRPVKVEGVVTLDGEAVQGAIVSFLPDEGGGRFACGMTGKDGSFRLMTYKPDDGALPGDYRVTVTLIPPDDDEDEAPANEKPEAGKDMMAAMMRVAAAKQKALAKSPVPAIYRDGGQTPLRQRVPAQGKVILTLKREQSSQQKP